MFFCYARYLFNGIRFQFHLVSPEFLAVRIYTRTANSSSERHATDRRTDRQRPSFHFIGQLTSHQLNLPSFDKGENKSQLIDIVSQPHQTMFQYTDKTLTPSRIRNIKTERSKQH